MNCKDEKSKERLVNRERLVEYMVEKMNEEQKDEEKILKLLMEESVD